MIRDVKQNLREELEWQRLHYKKKNKTDLITNGDKHYTWKKDTNTYVWHIALYSVDI